MRVIFAVEFKKYVVDASIFDIIIGKFCDRKKLCPVILFKIDKNLKIGFHYIIMPFS